MGLFPASSLFWSYFNEFDTIQKNETWQKNVMVVFLSFSVRDQVLNSPEQGNLSDTINGKKMRHK